MQNIFSIGYFAYLIDRSADNIKVPSYSSVSDRKQSFDSRNASIYDIGSILCHKEHRVRYSDSDNVASNDVSAMNWCNSMQFQNNVEIGVSWGSLSDENQHTWSTLNCDERIAFRKVLNCNDRWGESMVRNWKLNNIPIVQSEKNSDSSLICKKSFHSSFCTVTNGVIDFSRAEITQLRRLFQNGFVRTFGILNNKNFENNPDIFPVSGWINTEYSAISTAKCTRWEQRPTYIMSHDDIFNLGHHIEDVANVWMMLLLSSPDGLLSFNSNQLIDALFINMDGVRRSGPAGGEFNRLMVPNNPDELGPYNYYSTWFSEVKYILFSFLFGVIAILNITGFCCCLKLYVCLG